VILHTWYMLKTGVAMYIQVCRRSARRERAQQLLRRSKSILAEWKLNSTDQHIHDPTVEGLTANQTIHTFRIVMNTVKVGLPSASLSTTAHTKPSIASDFRYPSIKLNISWRLVWAGERLTRRTPYASFRNIAVPLLVSYGSEFICRHTYTDCSRI